MRSPGRMAVTKQEERRWFWLAVASGRTSEDAYRAGGVSPAVGSRWSREAGGMPPTYLAPWATLPLGRYLSFAVGEEIALFRVQGHGVWAIARRLGRAPSTKSRELRRNAVTRGGGLEYWATTAQWHAERAARRPRSSKLEKDVELRSDIEDRLAGWIARDLWHGDAGPRRALDQAPPGPAPASTVGQARRPEQISARLKRDFPEDQTMRIRHEAIYSALLHPRAQRAAKGVERVPAFGRGPAGSPGSQRSTRQVFRLCRDHDL